MASQLPPAVPIPEIPLAVHAFVLSANPKPYLTQNVMMYFFDQTKTWWRIQVDKATQNGDFQGLIEQRDPAAGNTILTLKQDAEKALSGAFMGVTNVQTSVPTAPWTEHQISNQYIAFTLSGTRKEVFNQYKGKSFGPKVAQGRTIIANTGVLKQHPHNTCVYGLITVGGNPLLPPLPPLPHLHEIFPYFDSLGIPRNIIRWFTHCTDTETWRRRMQELV